MGSKTRKDEDAMDMFHGWMSREERRRRCDEAIAYYFRTRGEISIPKLLRRFGIAECDFHERLIDIDLNYLATGELPFPPEVNAGIDEFEQLKQAAEKYHNYLYRQLMKPIASPGTYTGGSNRNAGR